MLVEHFLGKAVCTTYEELESILEVRTEKGVNEFIISSKEYYPFIMMSVKDDYATISYFDKEDESSFVSIGFNTDLEQDGITIFYTNTDKEEIAVENGFILPYSKATMVIKEFFETIRLPKCIEWEEL
ncbi:hypothetical protein J2Z32_000401 [Paenibacillus turicensis]|uniref:Immunity protein Imm1 n=1 Tax=Paenibacillus turicensis TaxID=160487 RepID=A0ABS4FMH8_9BACL|nr:hypothetical protein [Paenibacillus turicensis]MBP1903789.1 hypothetical protein [Paenibacillus turicensis]